MSLLFSLLREDHIIFASDSRHVRGDQNGRYKNDDAYKTERILGNKAILGFAGDDEVEEVIAQLKRSGELERGSLRDAARRIEQLARKIYGHRFKDGPPLNLQFLLSGFEVEHEQKVATSISIGGFPFFRSIPHSYEPRCDNFEIIGAKHHGALYVMRKCAQECMTIELGIRLACFTLAEVSKYEIRVGGEPQIYVIRPDREIENISDKLDAQKKWAADVGERIRTMIVTP
jgi:20S proteasome alpha/beta subunit